MTVRTLLLPLAPVWAVAVRLRRMAYRCGWAATARLPATTVSVGNLTFGGTGKTPVVMALVRDLVRRGRRPAVLTRGYGRSERAPLVLVGPEPLLSPAQAGDEPVEMAGRLPGVPIVVDADRIRGGREALRHGADILLLDDAFQHLRVERDLDLVVVDAGDPWGGGRMPPMGRLREPLDGLARASAVLVTKLDSGADATFAGIQGEVARWAPHAPVLGSRLVPSRIRIRGEMEDPETLRGRRVLAFAGIGRPEGFATVLQAAGAVVVGRRWFADHHRVSEGELAEILATARAQGAIAVTTAKDAVKLPPDAEIWVVETEVEPLDGDWDALWRLLPEA
jgi:tetraacyldisaccharide 4'-kinase